MLSPISPGTLDLPPDIIQGHGLQALDFFAGLTLEMGMGRMMLTGQFIVSRGPFRSQFADQPQAGEIVQDAVHSHFIDRTPGPDGLENLTGLPGPLPGPQNVQNPEAQRGGPQAALNQRLTKVAAITHMF